MKFSKTFAFILLTFTLMISFLGEDTYCSKPKSYIEYVSDPKEWKKLLRTRTNILVLYSKGKLISGIASTFSDASRELRGSATLVQIDCDGDGKKLCKKNRVDIQDNPYLLKHYKDGEFHKDYDRKERLSSMVTFLRDPAGDLPWDEDPIGEDVVHVTDVGALLRLLKREKSLMIMFYAPWCGFCKRLKPDFSAAASELKSSHVLAAMDLNKPENAAARIKFNITGFPTLIFFENGNPKYTYEGENNKAGIVAYMKNPGPVKKPKEQEWADENSDVVHLTDKTFHEYIKSHSSVVVMFYAPWCGHCKRMKPEYSSAATVLKESSVGGVLTAVDATKEKLISSQFSVKGFPTIKYFKDGEFAFDVSNLRTKDVIVNFVLNPQEPPPPPPSEAPWSETVSSVVHLDEENFKSFLKKKKHVLVMFYAPWCGHCKKAKPEFTAAAEKFSDDSKIEFAAVDCTVHTQVCGQNDVNGYPTFKYFNYYKTSKDYNGGRTEADFVNFMNDPDNPKAEKSSSHSDPKKDWESLEGSEFLHMLTESNFESFVLSKKNVLILFYAPWCGHCKAMKGDYALAAQQLNVDLIDANLAYVDATIERSLASKFQIKGYPTLKYFSNGVEIENYSGARKSSDFVSYMKNPPDLRKNDKTEL